MSTPMTAEEKAWIDGASYEQLLEKWRFSPAGDPFFTGQTAIYYGHRMKKLREEPGGHERHVAASKALGWRET